MTDTSSAPKPSDTQIAAALTLNRARDRLEQIGMIDTFGKTELERAELTALYSIATDAWIEAERRYTAALAADGGDRE